MPMSSFSLVILICFTYASHAIGNIYHLNNSHFQYFSVYQFINNEEPSTILTTSMNDINILAEIPNSSKQQVMSWTTFSVIITLLLLCIIIVILLIVWITKKTNKLLAENSKKRQYALASIGGVFDVQSPSINPVPVHKNEPIIVEGKLPKNKNAKMEMTPRGLPKLNEDKPQPPAVKIIDLATRKRKKRQLHIAHNASMEFDQHLADVAVGDAILMDDIVENMKIQNSQRDLVNIQNDQDIIDKNDTLQLFGENDKQTTDGSGSNNDIIDLETWIKKIVRLPEYYETFKLNSYHSIKQIKEIENKSKLEEIGIKLRGHQIKIWKEITKLKQKDIKVKHIKITKGDDNDNDNNINDNSDNDNDDDVADDLNSDFNDFGNTPMGENKIKNDVQIDNDIDFD